MATSKSNPARYHGAPGTFAGRPGAMNVAKVTEKTPGPTSMAMLRTEPIAP